MAHAPSKFKVLPKEQLAPGIDSGTAFQSVCINTAMYLPWLAGQCLKNGSVIKRAILNHISEAADLHHSGKKADVIVNCTGLLASQLGGVMDKNVVPARGQIVVVRNDPGIMATISGTDDGDDEATYVMHRAAGKSAPLTVLEALYIFRVLTLAFDRQVEEPSLAVPTKKAAGNPSRTQISLRG
ncbi:hypothetical protein FGG08_000393 [Glutinoglossum americanum]|uniref:FAD dependent oxidoreductase domain-containing protein n=1 Tax=Glutinoglossum americanum TaxID=1670608 RepID=A0A9P8L6X0_9PEZI|nr:hypothetical protein FGG08_000393 [Glutinoglossum americanum]